MSADDQPKRCEWAGCEVLHPNGVARDQTLDGWLCPDHAGVSVREYVKQMTRGVFEESLRLLDDPLKLAEFNRAIAPYGWRLAKVTPTGVCQFCKRDLSEGLTCCARCADERGP
jgi:hypothetical protein